MEITSLFTACVTTILLLQHGTTEVQTASDTHAHGESTASSMFCYTICTPDATSDATFEAKATSLMTFRDTTESDESTSSTRSSSLVTSVSSEDLSGEKTSLSGNTATYDDTIYLFIYLFFYLLTNAQTKLKTQCQKR